MNLKKMFFLLSVCALSSCLYINISFAQSGCGHVMRNDIDELKKKREELFQELLSLGKLNIRSIERKVKGEAATRAFWDDLSEKARRLKKEIKELTQLIDQNN